MTSAFTHARLRLLVSVGVIFWHGMLSASRLPGQPGPAMPFGQLSLPPLHDGSHDFEFLRGAWEFRQGRLIRPLSGPHSPMSQTTGRLVARAPEPGAATVEWETTPPDSTHAAGSARMSYDPKSKEWTIVELESRTASPEPPLIGHFEDGVGTFYGFRQYEGRTVLVRLSWRVLGVGRAELSRAFSIDGGTSWETHWIMHLSRDGRTPSGRTPREAVCCGQMELTWYTVPPGKEEEMVRLFARESFAMGDSSHMQDIALLRDIDHPTTFVLVRGFGSSEPRQFYDGLGWAAHRATLERAQIRADSVYELRAELGFVLGQRLALGPAARDSGIVVATIYVINQRRIDSYKFGIFLAQAVFPRTIAAGARLLGMFATTSFQISELWTGQEMVSAIRGRPLPPQRSGIVSFAWFADTAAYERHLQALEADPYWRETVAPALARTVRSMSATSRLVAVGRSRQLRGWVDREQ